MRLGYAGADSARTSREIRRTAAQDAPASVSCKPRRAQVRKEDRKRKARARAESAHSSTSATVRISAPASAASQRQRARQHAARQAGKGALTRPDGQRRCRDGHHRHAKPHGKGPGDAGRTDPDLPGQDQQEQRPRTGPQRDARNQTPPVSRQPRQLRSTSVRRRRMGMAAAAGVRARGHGDRDA